MNETLYSYYRQQDVLPTVGHFQEDGDLIVHEEHRRQLFLDKLKMPPQMFRGALLLEFGPDAGEHSYLRCGVRNARWMNHTRRHMALFATTFGSNRMTGSSSFDRKTCFNSPRHFMTPNGSKWWMTRGSSTPYCRRVRGWKSVLR